MGLDMYLFKRTLEGDAQDIGYWRKFNALHAFILGWTGSNPDTNCSPVKLTKMDVVSIKNILIAVKNILTTGAIRNDQHEIVDFVEAAKEAVREIMPPVGGFFWGSTEIDEYFYEKLIYSIEIFEVAQKEQEADKNCEIFYDCWW